MSVMIAATVSIVNKLMRAAMSGLAKFEKRITYSETTKSAAVALTFVRVVNAAILPFVASFATIGENFEAEFGYDFGVVFKAGALAEDITFVLLSLALFEPLFYFFTPMYYFSTRKRCCLKKLDDGSAADQTQAEANKLFEGPTLIVSE